MTLRPWALPLVPLYRAGLAVKNGLRDAGVLRQRRLTWPVVSVGSLSAGGAGKTPVVMMLAELLRERHVDVLSRGYGRSSTAVEQVAPAGDAARFGDEPMEMARAGLEGWVSADRYAAGLLAEGRGGTGVHLLDDGFQHRQLARDLDVVLLTLQDVADELLPAGNLREPLRALGRADVVVLREDEAGELAGLAVIAGKEIWVIRRRLEPVADAARLLAFCGIARPEGFFSMLGEVAGTLAFPDHHRYIEEDIDRLIAHAKACGAEGFVTTAKDEVKLTPAMRERLGRLDVARLTVELVDEGMALRRLFASCA